MNNKLRLHIVILGAFLLGAVVFGLIEKVYGQTPNEIIYACVNKSSGEIKITSAGSMCGNNESLVTWSSGGGIGPVTVGGGITGRWHITYDPSPKLGCGYFSSESTDIVLVQDSEGNITGYWEVRCTTNDVIQRIGVGGIRSGNTISLNLYYPVSTGGAVTQHLFQGTFIDQNNMSGTFYWDSSGASWGESYPWTAQRAYPVP